MATKADGSIDEDFYTKTQGFHPDFAKELRAAMQGAQLSCIGVLPNPIHQACMHCVNPPLCCATSGTILAPVETGCLGELGAVAT
jgi:hypothetical protein